MQTIKNRMGQRGQGGFTLIELLVVIAILAILAGVVVFAVGNSTKNAKVSACKTEVSSAKTGIAAAKAANEANAPASYEAPINYLENPGSFKYVSIVDATLTGSSSTWAVTATGMEAAPPGCTVG